MYSEFGFKNYLGGFNSLNLDNEVVHQFESYPKTTDVTLKFMISIFHRKQRQVMLLFMHKKLHTDP